MIMEVIPAFEFEQCTIGQAIPVILAGGLQQYLNKNPEAKRNVIIDLKKVNNNTTTFSDIPDYILLEIFSYMKAKELCRLAKVCRHWYWISSDNILWGKRLQKDMHCWKVIKHTTNPLMFLGCRPEWHNKEIYLRCSPEINQVKQLMKQNFPSLGLIYEVFWPKKTPRIAIFGPGLESDTGHIIRKILEDRSKLFSVKGMFPGQFEGLGSGFTIKMAAHTFHLITLYMSNKKERESHHGTDRLNVNKLLKRKVIPDQSSPHQGQQDAEESKLVHDEIQYVVTDVVKELCQTIDAFIFVTDSSVDHETVQCGKTELNAMISEECVKPDIPLAVLSCTSDAESTYISCVDVVSILELSRLNRPWQIHHCVVESMSGVAEAVQWLSETTAEIS